MMSDLKKLLDRCIVQDIEYVYSDDVQEQLDRIDKAIDDIAELYSHKISEAGDNAGQAAALEVMYHNAVSPMLAARSSLLETAVPRVILHLEEKPEH